MIMLIIAHVSAVPVKIFYKLQKLPRTAYLNAIRPMLRTCTVASHNHSLTSLLGQPNAYEC